MKRKSIKEPWVCSESVRVKLIDRKGFYKYDTVPRPAPHVIMIADFPGLSFSVIKTNPPLINDVSERLEFYMEMRFKSYVQYRERR